MGEETLKTSLNEVKKVFGFKKVLSCDVDSDYITKYYSKCAKSYDMFHSVDGSVHMALNYDGIFRKEGFYGQAEIIEGLLNKFSCESVLELGSGKGFNSIYLGERNQNLSFQGVDLNPKHLQIALKRSRKQKNVEFKKADFQKLSFEGAQFDLVFEVESVCHALEMKAVLKEVNRVLRPGGHFVLFDGFRKNGFENMDNNLKEASRLVEVSMAVKEFWVINEWIDLAKENNFEVVESNDLSVAILPNLKRLQSLSRRYFKHPFLAKIVSLMFPETVVYNAIAGLLMPFTVTGNAHGYYQIVLKKPKK